MLIKRFFAQIFGFRYCCPACGHLNTISRGRARSLAIWNQATGITQCKGCQKVYIAGLVLYESAGGRRSIRPDLSPKPKELAQIRGEINQVFEHDDRTGRFVSRKVKAGELVNRVTEVDQDLEED